MLERRIFHGNENGVMINAALKIKSLNLNPVTELETIHYTNASKF